MSRADEFERECQEHFAALDGEMSRHKEGSRVRRASRPPRKPVEAARPVEEQAAQDEHPVFEALLVEVAALRLKIDEMVKASMARRKLIVDDEGRPVGVEMVEQ